MKQKQKDDVVGSMEGEGLPEVDGESLRTSLGFSI